MKSRLFSLAALLMAGAATGALAQGQPTIENGGPMYNAGQAAKARQAQAQAQAQQQRPPEHGPHRPPQAPQPPQAGPPPQPAHQPPQPSGAPPAGERQNWNGHGPGRPGPGQPGPGQAGPDHRDHWDRGHWDGDPRGDDRRGDDRRGDDRRGDGRRDWNRPGDGRPGPDWEHYDRGPPPNAPRWAPRRYPPAYNSPSRYRGPSWRPPEGYYVRTWRYGEVLPRGWYGPDYQLFDWWSFALPAPPPGYDWIRIGRDALLVDDYGRIYQVVRGVFW